MHGSTASLQPLNSRPRVGATAAVKTQSVSEWYPGHRLVGVSDVGARFVLRAVVVVAFRGCEDTLAFRPPEARQARLTDHHSAHTMLTLALLNFTLMQNGIRKFQTNAMRSVD